MAKSYFKNRSNQALSRDMKGVIHRAAELASRIAYMHAMVYQVLTKSFVARVLMGKKMRKCLSEIERVGRDTAVEFNRARNQAHQKDVEEAS